MLSGIYIGFYLGFIAHLAGSSQHGDEKMTAPTECLSNVHRCWSFILKSTPLDCSDTSTINNCLGQLYHVCKNYQRHSQGRHSQSHNRTHSSTTSAGARNSHDAKAAPRERTKSPTDETPSRHSHVRKTPEAVADAGNMTDVTDTKNMTGAMDTRNMTGVMGTKKITTRVRSSKNMTHYTPDISDITLIEDSYDRLLKHLHRTCYQGNHSTAVKVTWSLLANLMCCHLFSYFSSFLLPLFKL